jgi:3-deoxy-D-manno-octulosonic-acid transferase
MFFCWHQLLLIYVIRQSGGDYKNQSTIFFLPLCCCGRTKAAPAFTGGAKIGKTPTPEGFSFAAKNRHLLLLLYNLAIAFYRFAINVASFRSSKAEQWIEGREDWRTKMAQLIPGDAQVIWMHCASAGEFEQGKPVAEALKEAYPEHFLLISFFSPSGYKVAQSYKWADGICYLPLDTAENARDFIQLARPRIALFVKYDYWFHFFNTLAQHGIPLLMIAAVFRPQQLLFKNKWFRKILQLPRHFFVQDEASLQLLKQTGIRNASLSGDTRFDRVLQIAASFAEVEKIQAFKNEAQLLVAGSTWKEDEEALCVLKELKLIIAPHEIDEEHLQEIEKKFPGSIRYSQYDAQPTSAVLIIDNVGMLSRVYRYADITYVGGGFSKDGVHNVLEAAVWAKPVIIGPNYEKYREAMELIECGGAFSFSKKEDLKQIVSKLKADPEFTKALGQKAKAYIEKHAGATQKIIDWIQENRLLTKS